MNVVTHNTRAQVPERYLRPNRGGGVLPDQQKALTDDDLAKAGGWYTWTSWYLMFKEKPT